MGPTATARTRDGSVLQFTVDNDETILDAAVRAGSTLPSLCRRGTCGVCRAQLVSGTVRHDPHTDDALNRFEKDDGGMLLCCARPHEDVVIDLPYDASRVLDGAVPARRATLTRIDRWPGDILRLVMRVESDEHGSAMQFEAGQFAELTPPGCSEARAYSFANTGNWDGDAEFYIKLREDGYFSGYIRDHAAIGDVLTLTGPQGTFTLQENGRRPRWMVCGGTGLAPLVSMLRRMADWGEAHDCLLILGVNSPDEVFAVQELDDLCRRLRLRILVSVVTANAEWDGHVGTAVDVLASELAAAPAGDEPPDIYMCGSPGFLVAARHTAQAGGVPHDQVHEERILAN